MSIRLRGHHLLCLLGYRGMGYSEEFAANMTQIYEQLRNQPQTIILITEGPDDLCICFPTDQVNHCKDQNVYERDQIIIRQLGLKLGTEVTWGEILSKVRKSVVPENIPVWCSTCPWQPYGVCEKGIEHIRSGQNLMPLEQVDGTP